MNWLKLVGIISVAWFLAERAAAEVIELPQDELAKESVLPVFDRPVSVRNRAVVTAGKFDVNLSYGLALSEPIYNVSRYGFSVYYNPSENNSLGLMYAKNAAGVSSYAEQLRDQYKLEFDRAPSPQSTIMGDWDWKMYYGKMSVMKDSVLNLSIYTTFAAGVVQYQHKNYPTFAPGLGQKFYFGKHFALRLDLRLFMGQAPIPFLKGHIVSTDPKPSYSDFDERMTYTTVLDTGLSWLF